MHTWFSFDVKTACAIAFNGHECGHQWQIMWRGLIKTQIQSIKAPVALTGFSSDSIDFWINHFTRLFVACEIQIGAYLKKNTPIVNKIVLSIYFLICTVAEYDVPNVCVNFNE